MDLNVARLVKDCGGAAAVAEICGVWRTAPYSWIKRRYISSRIVERLKAYDPNLDIDGYFDGNQRQNNRGNGVDRPREVDHPDQA